jgi:hypothetical protein
MQGCSSYGCVVLLLLFTQLDRAHIVVGHVGSVVEHCLLGAAIALLLSAA